MTDDPEAQARRLSSQLKAAGHHAAATDLDSTIARHRGNPLLEALRETCQTLLTAVESLDPAAYNAIEELRLDLDARLGTGRTSG